MWFWRLQLKVRCLSVQLHGLQGSKSTADMLTDTIVKLIVRVCGRINIVEDEDFKDVRKDMSLSKSTIMLYDFLFF